MTHGSDTVEKLTNVFMEQYTLPTDTNEMPNLLTRNDMKTLWLSNEETMNLRSENNWTIDLKPHTVIGVTHDDDETAVVADEETYETHYGLRDPMLDVFRRSYLHVWTINGAHARFVTYAEHTVKCKSATILKWSPVTFYRWKQKEEENYAKSPDGQVSKVPKKRKVNPGKERTGKGNLGDQKHWRQRIRTQMIDGNSQSDVTVQDLEDSLLSLFGCRNLSHL